MKLLALETANEQCSVSIVDDIQELFFQLDERTKAQTQMILPMIEKGLQQTSLQLEQLSAIAFSRGPVHSAAYALMLQSPALAWANDLPVIPVSTLQALAQAAYRLTGLKEVSAVLDARMQEVYIGSFQLDEQHIMRPVAEEQLLDYETARQAVQFPLVGSGSALVDTAQVNYQQITATAQDIAAIARVQALKAEWLSAEQALPVYLRDNAWKKYQNKVKHN